MSEVSMEFMRNFLGKTKEQEDAEIEEQRAKNPVALLAKKVEAEVDHLDKRTQGMQEIDFFTLDLADLIDKRTAGMQDIDQFTLDLAFVLMARIDELEQRIITLEGGA